MLFNSFVFLLFLSVILPIFYSLPTKFFKNLFLVCVSYLFYAYWDWRFCFLLVFSTIVDFFVGKQISLRSDKVIKKRLLFVSLFTNIGILFTFKYFNFFIDSLNIILKNFNQELDFLHLNLLLPVGISFYTFQTLSYTIDIYRGKLQPNNNFLDFSLFVAFFPQLVAGPIERATSLLPQLSKKLNPTKKQLKQGVTLIVLGLFKKVIIGDTAGRYVDHIFNDLSIYKSIEIVIAIALFGIQIYADFSGYSHIARGIAKLLGVELTKNFEQPYFSKSITEFWRRWHISLSLWLKDYLYIPLGGNKKKGRLYTNLMLTMLIGGLWHGASWNFIIWGGLHGVYLCIDKFFSGKKTKTKTKSKARSIFNNVFVYLLVSFTWLFFRAQNVDSIMQIFHKLLNWEASEYTMLFIRIYFSYLILTLLLDFLELKYGHTWILKTKNNSVILGVLSALFVVVLTYMFQADPSPFVYFQF